MTASSIRDTLPDWHPVERASRADAAWFRANPTATARLRPRVAGEFSRFENEIGPAFQFVLVTLLGPGLRIRQPAIVTASLETALALAGLDGEEW